MARPRSKHPTELELEILKILWNTGPVPARKVQELLKASSRPLAHTSVLTIMNIMTRKGYLKRRKVGSCFEYAACITERATSRNMLRDLLHRVFAGSASAMVLRLLESDELDPAELARLRRIVNRKSKEK